VWPDYLTVKDWTVESGGFFSDRDEQAKSKVAVLGATVAEELFGDEDPIGERIRINNTPFSIVGVMESKGSGGFGQDQDDVVLVPASTALYRLAGGTNISMIMASAPSTELSGAAQEEAAVLMRESHRIEKGEEDDFQVRTQAEMMEAMTSVTEVMTLLLGSVAAVSLVVGGIGIMNIMLVSVTERTREIGLRMAVGAHGRDVMSQFLTESILMSLTGGAIGTALAYGVSAFLNNVAGMTVVIAPVTVLISFGFAAGIGVFFGYYPARKAARLNPIEALRFE
jgi:putative ABC transport system permease protein